MCYVLKRGKKYIQQGKEGFVAVKHLADATRYSTQKKAANVMECLPKEFKVAETNIFEVNGTLVKPVLDITISLQVNNQPVTITNKNKKKKSATISTEEAFAFDDKEIRDSILSISREIKRLQDHKEYLVEMLRKMDLETSDILHYLEFNNFSACEGYKLSKQLQEIRLERRKYKDALALLEAIDTDGKSLVDNSFLKKVESVYTRVYEPRVLNELFG